MLPMMQADQIRHIEQTLLKISNQPVNVLEWGSGGSTVYYTRFLRSHGISYNWLAVEHDQKWHAVVAKALAADPDTQVVYIPAGANRENWRTQPMNEYVNYPDNAKILFDVIIVDGRKRRRCMEKAKQLLKPGGVIFLHDAQRSWYRCAMRAYPSSRYASYGLWRGEDRDVSTGEQLKNLINRFYFQHLSPTLRSLVRMRFLKRIFNLESTPTK